VDRPRIDELLGHAGGSRYALAIIAAKRARQINNYYNSLGGLLDYDSRRRCDPRSKNSHDLSRRGRRRQDRYTTRTDAARARGSGGSRGRR
jgi:DNA-directed RNA polymerase omega subunit